MPVMLRTTGNKISHKISHKTRFVSVLFSENMVQLKVINHVVELAKEINDNLILS